jgi:DNA-binding LytR/AlgR family response regulator
MKIAICDDQQNFITNIEIMLNTYANTNNLHLELLAFNTGDALLEYYTKHNDIDLMLLDIHMPNITGLEVARCIKETGATNNNIVFITSDKSYALAGYSVEAMDFIVKPITYESFSIKLDKILMRVDASSKEYIIVKNCCGSHKVNFSDILYIDTLLRNVTIHCKDNVLKSSKSLKYYEKHLDSRFFKCHASCLVNMREVNTIEKLTIHMSNKEQLIISKGRKSEFSSHMAKYYGDLISSTDRN